MKFDSLPLAKAEGKILAHNISGPDGARALKKGTALSAADLAILEDIGQTDVYVAELDQGDIGENQAAQRVALAASGSGLDFMAPNVGRVNIQSQFAGIFRVNSELLQHFNQFEEIAISTLLNNSVVHPEQVVAKVKIIPFAASNQKLAAIEKIAADQSAVIHVDKLNRQNVSLILMGSGSAETRIKERFKDPIQARIEALGSALSSVEYVILHPGANEGALIDIMLREKNAGVNLIIIAGETAIMDRNDIAPRAIAMAGGEVISLGAPVDPGNLLMLAYIEHLPVLGAPGCAASKKTNIVDEILPRLLSGERMLRGDVAALGHGGLLASH